MSILGIDGSYEINLTWMPQDQSDGKSTQNQAMA